MNRNFINNRYEILKKLGEGGMGEIFLVEDKLYNQKVALKTIRKEIAKQETIDRFKVEFEVMTRLKHPNLARVYDFGFSESGNTYFLTMEYVEGVTLKKWIEENRPTKLEESVLDIFVDLLRAIEFIHSRNILHRDIKPDNIMIINNEELKIKTKTSQIPTSYHLKLMDFGLADLGKKESAQTKGTLLYLAPEVLAGNVDERTDIFSLGVTLYNLLAGNWFYGSTINTKTISGILKDKRKFDQNQLVAMEKLENSDLSDIISKMTEFKPENRYSSCTEIICDINEKLGKNYLLETEDTKKAYVLGANFVGREKELEGLINWLDLPKSEKKLLRVHGEAGIGKSRLFDEFRNYCQLRNIKFLQSDSKEIGQKGFGAFLPLLKEMLLDAPKDLVRKYDDQLVKLLPEHSTVKNIEPAPKQDAKIEHGILIQSITDFILDCAAISGKKIVLFLNDLHWTDDASIEALAELLYKMNEEFRMKNEKLEEIEKEDNSSLKIYASSRPKNLNKLDPIKAKGRLSELPLYPFDEDNVKSYIQAVFGAEKIDDSLEKAIPEISQKVGGNPYFLQELTKSLVNLNLIERKKEAWTLTESIENAKLPNNLKDLIQSHLEQLSLSADELRILQILALINYPPTFEELNRIESFERNILNKLENVEIVKIETEKEKVHYRTAHDLIREVIIEGIEDKKQLHQLIGEKLERIHAENLEEYISELAYHYGEAENREKALPYLEKAGNAAKENYQNQQAIEFYDKLLNILDKNQTEQRIDILLKKASILEHIGKWKESEKNFDKAVELAISIENEKLIADSKRKKANLMTNWSKYDEALSLLNESKSIYKKLDFKGGLSDIYNTIGGIYHYQSDYDAAKKYYEKSVEYARQLDDQERISYGMLNIGFYHLHKANYKEALEIFWKYISIFEKSGNQKKYSQIIANIGTINMFQGNYEEAINSYMESMEISQKMGNKHSVASALGNTGLAYMYQDEHEKAKDYFQRSLFISEELNDRKNMGIIFGNLGIVYKEMGKLDKALEYYEKDLEIAREFNNKSSICAVLINAGNLYEIKGNDQKAIDCCEEAIEIGEEIGEPRILSAALGNLAGIYKRHENYEKAEELYDKSLAIAKEGNIQYYYSAYLDEKADLYFTLGKFDEAEKLNREAMEIARKIRNQGTLFSSKILSAKLFFVKDQREKALEQLQEMLTESEGEADAEKLHYEIFMLFLQTPDLSQSDKIRMEKHRRQALEFYEKAYQETPNLIYKKYLDNLKKEFEDFKIKPKEKEPVAEEEQEEEEDWENLEDSFM